MSHWLVVSGLLLSGVGGGFGPWVWHKVVALQLTAPGLAEFVKFLPEVRTGQIRVERLLFLLPLFWAMLMLPAVANKLLDLSPLLRWVVRLATIPLALIALSPVWTPAVLMSAEFRLQTLLVLVSIGLVLAGPLASRLPLKLLAVGLIGGNIVVLTLASWQFYIVQASIAETYREPILPGWGWWLIIGGVILTVIGSLRILWPGRSFNFFLMVFLGQIYFGRLK